MATSKRDNPEEIQRRIQAATNEFRALLARHRVVFTVEQGTNSATGTFTRIAFGVTVPKPEDPVPT